MKSVTPLRLLETAASPKSFLILCSDMNLGLKMEKVGQGSFLFISTLYHFECLFFWALWPVMLLELQSLKWLYVKVWQQNDGSN